MTLRFYSNAPATTLTAAVTNSATVIAVASVTGLPVSFPYTLILDLGKATEEVVEVSAAAGTSLTISRGVDGTTAFAHDLGSVVSHGISARDIREANSHINATAGVHGVVGTLVGTSDTQALTNKDLTSGNTFPTSLVTTSGSQTLTNKTLISPTVQSPSISGGSFSSLPSGLFPAGLTLPFAGTAAPTGWLLADGSAVSRTTYSGLFAAIGTAFGAGNGTTTFNLPDLKGRIPVGYDAAGSYANAIGGTGGEATHTLTANEMPSHQHFETNESWKNTGGTQKILSSALNGSTGLFFGTTSQGGAPRVQVDPAGGGAAHNILQPYVAMNYIIKT